MKKWGRTDLANRRDDFLFLYFLFNKSNNNNNNNKERNRFQVERVRDDMRTAGMTPSEEYLQDSPDTSGSCALDINSVQRVMEVWSFYRYPLFNWWCVNYFSTSTLPSYARHKRTESRQSRENCSKRNDWKGKERKGLLVAFDSCPPKKKVF